MRLLHKPRRHLSPSNAWQSDVLNHRQAHGFCGRHHIVQQPSVLRPLAIAGTSKAPARMLAPLPWHLCSLASSEAHPPADKALRFPGLCCKLEM